MVADKFLAGGCFGKQSIHFIYVDLTETKSKLHREEIDCKVYVVPNLAIIFGCYDLKVTQKEDLKNLRSILFENLFSEKPLCLKPLCLKLSDLKRDLENLKELSFCTLYEKSYFFMES